MAVGEQDLYDFLHEVFRAGGSPGSRAVMLSRPSHVLEPQWGREHFWDVAQEAEKRGLIEPGRGMYVSPTLAGERMLQAGRPASGPPQQPADLLTNVTELASQLSALSDEQFSAVELTVSAEQVRRRAGGGGFTRSR